MSGYLRRYRLEPRRNHGRLVVAVLLLMIVLFAKVWQSTAASSLSMERDRLRREVRVLENRIRLSSELRVQAALREGLDPRALTALGFRNPDPAAVVNIELSDAGPSRARRGDGVVARFTGLLRGMRGGESSRRADETRAIAVAAPIPAALAAEKDPR